MDMFLKSIPYYDGIASRLFWLKTVVRNALKRNGGKKPEAFLCIDNLYDRHLYLLAEFFVQAGYYVYIVGNVRIEDYYNSDPYRFYVYTSHDMKYISRLPEKIAQDSLLCADHEPQYPVGSRFGLTLSLRYDIDIAPATRPEAMILPYPMHPNVYHEKQIDTIYALRTSSKRMGVFFAGNLKEQYELQSNLLRNYVPRRAAVRSVRQRFGSQVRLFTTRTSLLRALDEEDLASSIVIFDATTERLGREEWFSVLAQSRFFLALPGVVMPMCHNSVEAMALGVVPILGYGQLFSPPLASGNVCLGYGSETELAGAIDVALAMDAGAYAALRQRSLDHYDRHMAPAAFLRGLSRRCGQPMELRFAAEWVSENLARAAARS